VDTLGGYLDIVASESGIFGDMTLVDANNVFNPPKSNKSGGNGSGNGNSGPSDATNESATGSRRKKGGSKNGDGTKLDKSLQNAEKQLLAAWLNFAKGAINWDEMIDTTGDDTPDTPFGDLITTVEIFFNQGDYEAAKDLAESVNNHDKDNGDCDTGTGSGSKSGTASKLSKTGHDSSSSTDSKKDK